MVRSTEELPYEHLERIGLTYNSIDDFRLAADPSASPAKKALLAGWLKRNIAP
jgi:hypothetical protein